MEEERWECPAPGCRQTFGYKNSATKHFHKVHPVSAEAQRTVGERQSQRITEQPHAAQSADLRLRDSDVAVGLALRPGREPPADEEHTAGTARIALLIIVTVLATGSLPAVYGAAGVEVFHKGQRLQGSHVKAAAPPRRCHPT